MKIRLFNKMAHKSVSIEVSKMWNFKTAAQFRLEIMFE